jgi:DNA-binding winged helix-turn-helix (wHTH) protein
MLRHALEDSVKERYIATDYRRGYRFLGEVSERPPPVSAEFSRKVRKTIVTP